ncbi:O-linked N-acetylglucosamine transferase [Acetobacter estunensis NRIC 0472]|uniref:Tetratricopeptide repeat protein n=1 Tax=Acetobacter estunensis TaxID=104097 RepID=A0A967B6Y0_9PROT|nr:tetratricopeptide repeat protein [Acetobacter estunensis]NHO53524.1 tetratricopeptide repeat protein [Acetobacter estunensis]GBQ28822.1 O-linked N-acetylglucosamine transferase [Acetobacter estunensis NRIC 0472]
MNLPASTDPEELFLALKRRREEEPDNADILHALARTAYDLGRFDLAIAYGGLALKADPRPAWHVTLGLALLRAGHAEAARAALHVAALNDPFDPSISLALADVLETMGELAAAESELRRVVKLRPLEAGHHLVLGQFLARTGQPDRARVELREAKRLAAPDDVLTRHAEGSLLAAFGELDEAEPLFAEIRTLRPHDPAAAANHGAVLFELGRLDAADAALTQACVTPTPTAATWTNLGLTRMAMGDLRSARQALDHAAALQPDDPRIALNRGTLLAELGHTEEATALFRGVMELAPKSRDAERARFNLGTLELGQGLFDKGWHDFEARRGLVQPWPRPDVSDWTGEAVSGRVLLCGEQGLGDFIQFLRFVPLALLRAPVLLLVPDSMRRLIESSLDLPVWQDVRQSGRLVIGADAHAAEVVARASLLSLPHVLGASVPPDETVYLATGSVRRSIANKEKMRVGLCWSGNPAYRFDRRRSLKVDWLGPLLDVPGIEWVSLQPEDAPDGFEPLPAGDMATTAAVMETLDLVISVDTAMVHLAGALGVPVWLLNRFGGDWRWRAGNWSAQTGESLWYPQLRMFAQTAPDLPSEAWKTPLMEVSKQLRCRA